MRQATKGKRHEGGQVLLLFVLAVAVLIGFTAMTIDVGMLFENRRHLQNTADAAALAGVADLPFDPPAAKQHAQEWILKNNITADKITAIEVRTTSFPNDTLYVEVDQDFDWIFARVLGQTSSTVGAQAAARTGSLIGGHDIMPWALLMGDSSCVDPVTGYPLFVGNPCTVKVGAGSAMSGWYGALDMDGIGGGAAEYRSNIVDGQADTGYCVAGATEQWCESSTIDTLNGNQVAGTGKGIADRLASEPACGAKTGIDEFNEVFAPTGQLDPKYNVLCPASPRLIIVPIVSFTSVPVHKVTIEGWSLAYLKSYTCVGGNVNNCGAVGHWEVQIQLVDAAYSDAAGFLGAYDPLSGITVRRLVE
jgi:hypothetical protein